jgi:hypothetical protein
MYSFPTSRQASSTHFASRDCSTRQTVCVSTPAKCCSIPTGNASPGPPPGAARRHAGREIMPLPRSRAWSLIPVHMIGRAMSRAIRRDNRAALGSIFCCLTSSTHIGRRSNSSCRPSPKLTSRGGNASTHSLHRRMMFFRSKTVRSCPHVSGSTALPGGPVRQRTH